MAAAALSDEGGGGVGALLEAVGFGEGGGRAFVGDRPFLLTDGDFDAGVGFEGGDEGLGLRLVERGVEAFVEGCRPDGLAVEADFDAAAGGDVCLTVFEAEGELSGNGGVFAGGAGEEEGGGRRGFVGLIACDAAGAGVVAGGFPVLVSFIEALRRGGDGGAVAGGGAAGVAVVAGLGEVFAAGAETDREGGGGEEGEDGEEGFHGVSFWFGGWRPSENAENGSGQRFNFVEAALSDGLFGFRLPLVFLKHEP